MSRGIITKEYTIWCVCEEWHQESGFNNKKQFERMALNSGWTKKGGKYHCPKCSGKKSASRQVFPEMMRMMTNESKGGES